MFFPHHSAPRWPIMLPALLNLSRVCIRCINALRGLFSVGSAKLTTLAAPPSPHPSLGQGDVHCRKAQTLLPLRLRGFRSLARSHGPIHQEERLWWPVDWWSPGPPWSRLSGREDRGQGGKELTLEAGEGRCSLGEYTVYLYMCIYIYIYLSIYVWFFFLIRCPWEGFAERARPVSATFRHAVATYFIFMRSRLHLAAAQQGRCHSLCTQACTCAAPLLSRSRRRNCAQRAHCQ